MGLFKDNYPVWKDYNLEKAIKAVEKETDQAKMYEITNDAALAPVRLLAATKLTDQSLAQRTYADLYNRSLFEEDRKRAVEKMTDQKLLTYISKKDLDPGIRDEAKLRLYWLNKGKT